MVFMSINASISIEWSSPFSKQKNLSLLLCSNTWLNILMNSLEKLLFLSILLATVACSSLHLVSAFTSQQKLIAFQDSHPNPYSIDISRLSSTFPTTQLHCKGYGRQLDFNGNYQLIRLHSKNAEGKEHNQQQTVYQNLISLEDTEEIVEFQMLEDRFYLVSSWNKVYFYQWRNGTMVREASVELPESVQGSVSRGDFFVLIIDFAPFLIFPKTAIICTEGLCKELSGWAPIKQITHATFLKTPNGQRYIIVGQKSNGIAVYHLTPSNELQKHTVYTSKDFHSNDLSIYDVSAKTSDRGELFALDYSSGLFKIEFDPLNPTKFNTIKKVLDHSGCFAMDLDDRGFMVMNCRAGHSEYLIEATYDRTQEMFTLRRPSYKYETIFDIDLTDRYYVSRGYLGLKFYWYLHEKPYPQKHKSAGQLFLHNAVQFRLKKSGLHSVIYYITPNSLRYINIVQKQPYASCMSTIQTEQQYLMNFTIPCQQNPQQICTFQQSIKLQVWKHTQVSMRYVLIPTIISFVAVILVSLGIAIVYRRYGRMEEEVSLRHANCADEFNLDSNR